MSPGRFTLESFALIPGFGGFSSRQKNRIILRPLNGPMVLAAEQMVALIKRECARIDRNGLPCAMAVFHIPNHQRSPANVDYVLAVLRERARLSDVIGWLDEKTLAVFVTDSSAEGARAFGESVCAAAAGRLPELTCTVHNYDGKWAAFGATGIPAEPIAAFALSA